MCVIQNVPSVNVVTRWPRADVCTSPVTSAGMSSVVAVWRHSNVERFEQSHYFLRHVSDNAPKRRVKQCTACQGMFMGGCDRIVA